MTKGKMKVEEEEDEQEEDEDDDEQPQNGNIVNNEKINGNLNNVKSSYINEQATSIHPFANNLNSINGNTYYSLVSFLKSIILQTNFS